MPATNNVHFYHFEHGTESSMVELTEELDDDAELFVLGNDDAAGIGALGLSTCLSAELPRYSVRCVLFEDHDLSMAQRESIVHNLRSTPTILEHAHKITKSGQLFVNKLIYGAKERKACTAPGATIAADRTPVAYVPPSLSVDEIEVSVEALGTVDIEAPVSLVSFVGTVSKAGSSAKIGVRSKVEIQLFQIFKHYVSPST